MPKFCLTKEEREDLKMAASAIQVVLDADPDISKTELNNAHDHAISTAGMLYHKMYPHHKHHDGR